MRGVFKSLVLSETAIKHIDVYGTIVVLNRRLSQEFVRKSLARCFMHVRKHTEAEQLYGHGFWFKKNDTSYWLGYLLHRDSDQPAVITSDGEQHWYQYGEHHRDNDSPAVIDKNGYQGWYQHGKQHRDNDRPAVITSYGEQHWYQHGEWHRNNDQPAIINKNGFQGWYQHGKRHRDNDQPAVITSDGSQYWYQHGERHRNNDQPAVIHVIDRYCHEEWYEQYYPK